MANANISSIQVTNTFDEWRVATNDLIQDRNILRNATYVKDDADLQLANGALMLSRSTGGVLLTISGTGGALVGGTTTTSDLIVQDDASVANNLTVTGNVIASGNVTVGKNVNVAMQLAVTGNVSVNVDKFTIDSNTGNVSVKGDIILDGGDLVSTPANANVINTSSDTVNFGGSASLIRVGSTGGTTLLRGKANVTGAANLLLGANVTGELYVSGQSTVAANAFFGANVNVSGNVIATGPGTSRFGNILVQNVATIDNAFITTLTLTLPIQSLGTGANSWSLRMGSSSDGDGFFRIQRSVASGNVDIFWDETDDTWKFVRNYPSHGNERANLSATLKSVRDFVINTTALSTQTVDLSQSNYFRYTLNSNTTFVFANAPVSGVGITATLLINQDGTGSRTIAFANDVYYANGTAPSPTTNANSEDMWTFTTYDGGASFIGALAIKDSFVRRIPDGVIEYLVVAGGGGGGAADHRWYHHTGGGGGGGGGVLTSPSMNIVNAVTHTVTVGAGGAGAWDNNFFAAGVPSTIYGFTSAPAEPRYIRAANGANSSITAAGPFANLVSIGGGAGGQNRFYGAFPSAPSGIGVSGITGGSGGGGGIVDTNALFGNAPAEFNLTVNLPWYNGAGPGDAITIPYTYTTPGINRATIFGGNTTSSGPSYSINANLSVTFNYDAANDHFAFNYGSVVGFGPSWQGGGSGTPGQGFAGGSGGYLYTDNAHSTRVNAMPGFIGGGRGGQPASPSFTRSPLVISVDDYNKSYYIQALIIGGSGAGGGGGGGGIGETPGEVKIGPPYGGINYDLSFLLNDGTVPLINPIAGTAPPILSGQQRGGNGGIGVTSTISGSSVIYAAGGGGYGYAIGGKAGGNVSANGAGAGGFGGQLTYGPTGSFTQHHGTPGYTGNTATNAAFSTAVTNRGGGGGGSSMAAGAGGSGVVILRYPIRSLNGKILYIPASSNTGSPTYTESGGYRIYTFTGSGSITWAV